MRRFWLALTAILWASGTHAAPADELKQLLTDHWSWYLRNNPVQATELGVRDYDSELGDPSLAQADREAKEAQAFLERLNAIDPAGLSPADRINRDILERVLERQVEANRFPQRTRLFTNRGGWHLYLPRLYESVPLFTLADYESYVARLDRVADYNQAAIEVTREALRTGQVQPCEAMEGFDASISTHVVPDPKTSIFYTPFTQERPSTVPQADWTRLQGRAHDIIAREIVPAYRQFAKFYASEYAPRCAKSVSVADLPQGRDYYAFRVRDFTTTDLTPDQIHELGLKEVARIQAEMDAVAKRANFPSRAAYINHLRTSPEYYATSPEQLLRLTSEMTKRIDGEMPKLFGRLPRLPYTVKPIPLDIAAGTTTAYYEPGAMEAGRAGVYRVNTTKLDQRPLFELPALTVHEAVPGHHHQIALQQELDLPDFRRHAAYFTAFTEGWGLYSERLGIEMGLYDTPAKDMGRLSYEMWRAARLVVDTGMHAKGWTKEQAIAFMEANTALSRANIEAEVNRYITWPGQALAYKIGELKIRELRERAQSALGNRFSLRDFHDTVLENGAVPLDVLEAHVNAWIERQRAQVAAR